MIDKEALKLALEALECANSPNGDYENEITALKERLAQPEQEPVAEVIDWGVEGPRLKGLTEDWPRVGTLLYTTPPQRTWVGLTDEEQQQAYEQWQNDGWGVFYNAIEAKLKEKNT